MKASDIDDAAVLRFLATRQGAWTMTFALAEALPKDIPRKVLLAKMRQLHKRGFVGGCTCGCRGDWEITDAGLLFIEQKRTRHYSGYGGVVR